MSGSAKKLLHAAAGSASDDSVYVEDVFSTDLSVGTGSAITVNNGIDLSGEGGLVIYRRRDSAENWSYQDTIRGVDSVIYSDSINAAADPGSYGLDSFNSNGFTTEANTFTNAGNIASWTFRKQEGFFDIVTYTGTGSSKTVSHNLGCVPGMILVKMTSTNGYKWRVWHKSLGNSKALCLNDTSAESDDGGSGGGWWNNTAPTSSVFSVGTYGQVNNNGDTFIAYLFADGDSSDAQIFGDDGDEAIIKTGSFTPTGSGTAKQTINVGFEPQFLLLKNSTSTQSGNWWIFDNMRGFTGGDGSGSAYLLADSNGAESTFGAGSINITNQGFEMTNNAFVSSSQTFVYMAIRRGPMKEPSAGTDVFKAISRTGGGGSASITGVGFSPDLYLSKATNQGSYNPVLYNRLRGKRYLLTSATDAQPSSDGGLDSYDMDGVTVSGSSAYGLDGSGDSIINYFFKRYPKVFDVVVYEGNGSNSPFRTINHNLGVAPELVIIKNVDQALHWGVNQNTGDSDVDGDVLYLNLNGAYSGADGLTASATTVTLNGGWGGTAQTNGSGDTHLMLMFASLSGISKVGAYTGTGNDLNVTDLGASARFVLIKRTDASGDWYVYDSTSGIVSGNDPYFFINSTAVSVTNTDYIDPHSSGFTITSSAPDALNASSGKYLYLALA